VVAESIGEEKEDFELRVSIKDGIGVALYYIAIQSHPSFFAKNYIWTRDDLSLDFSKSAFHCDV
jgi:hypothetical protein